MRYTDKNVKDSFASHPEVDMSRLAYIYAYHDRARGLSSWVKLAYYFIGWDTKNLYLMRTNLLGNEKNFRTIGLENIEHVEIKDRILNTRINLKIKGEDILRLDCAGKVMNLKNQHEHLQTILTALKSRG